MQAIIQRKYGFPEDVLQVREVPEPAVGDTEVLVQVFCSSIAGDDWHLMRGQPYVARVATGLRAPRNRIPGRDVAGRVQSIGAAVTRFQPGDEVFGWCDGGMAEYVAVSEDALMPKPVNLTSAEAAAVPISALTALQAVREKGNARPGAKVLVIGASGGVGTFAVQLAKAFGTEVVGVCSSGNVALVQSLGADRVVDYSLEDFAAGGDRYDAIVDLVGNRSMSALRRTLKPDGTLVMVGGSGGRWFKGTNRFLGAMLLSPFSRQRLRPLIHQDRREDLATLKELIEAGLVRPVVSAEYRLSEVQEAIRHFAEGHGRGKVVITVADSRSRAEPGEAQGARQLSSV
jgi:NADPH:quinone reductase-like Zn-dependent oxidoreductase